MTNNMRGAAPDESSPNPPALNPDLSPTSRRSLSIDDYLAGLQSGDRAMLSRAITLVESTRPADRDMAYQLVERCMPALSASSLRLGVTGVPGAGKSTFIEALGLHVLDGNRQLAVLTLDPSSERSNGSILGDKTRMNQLAAHESAFVRPSPTSGTLGGVGQATREAVLLCEAAGFDTVIVETVGIGQGEIAVQSLVDVCLLMVLHGAGDDLQGIKRGIMEVADLVVLNKTDRLDPVTIEQAQAAYRDALHLFPARPSGWDPPVLPCSALTGDGIEETWNAIITCRNHLQQGGFLEEKRREQARYWMHQAVEHGLLDAFYSDPSVQEQIEKLEDEIEAGRVSPFAAARQLIASYHVEKPHR